jgi:hypothetical protein
MLEQIYDNMELEFEEFLPVAANLFNITDRNIAK